MSSNVKNICNELNIKYETVCTYAHRHHITINEAINYYIDRYNDSYTTRIPTILLNRNITNPKTNETYTIKQWINKKSTTIKDKNKIANYYFNYMRLYKNTNHISDFAYIDELFSIILFTKIRKPKRLNFYINATMLIRAEINPTFSVITANRFPNGSELTNAYTRFIRQNISIRDCVIEEPYKFRKTVLNEPITINNITKPAYVWCREYNVSTSIFASRVALKNRTNKECLLFKSKYNQNYDKYKYNRKITYNNITHTLCDWCRILGITETAFNSYKYRNKTSDDDIVKYYINKNKVTV